MKASEAAADIIIPVYNQYSWTRNLLEGIYRYTDLPFHIYIIDNASEDETVDLGKIYSRDITIIRNRQNQNRCLCINQGIQLGKNPNLIFMDNVVEVSQGWLGDMIAFLDTHPRIGAVGPLSSCPDDRQCVDKVREKIVPQIPHFLTRDLHERNRILKYHFHRAGILIDDLLAFFCVALKRSTVNAVGLLADNLSGGGDGDDYCRRLRESGYVLGLSLDTYVLHHSNSAAAVSRGYAKRQMRCRSLPRIKEKRAEYY
jgi:GT2 family glycosyltransferase